MNILNEKEEEMQEKFEEIIQETGTKLIDYANEIGLGYEAIDILLVDFIANLIDFVLAFRFGNLLYVNYKAGFITYEQARALSEIDEMFESSGLSVEQKAIKDITVGELVDLIRIKRALEKIKYDLYGDRFEGDKGVLQELRDEGFSIWFWGRREV